MTDDAAKAVIDGLKSAGIDFVATLPEANLQNLVGRIAGDAAFTWVPLAREEEGFGICAGAWLGGKKPAMVMMDAGFLASCTAVATLNVLAGIPVLLILGLSGGLGEKYWMHSEVGRFTEPVLKAMNVVYQLCERVEDLPV
ncbi:MAG: thiamine pyrophosphate-binding protein, partial [Chloroflexota bacterium]